MRRLLALVLLCFTLLLPAHAERGAKIVPIAADPNDKRVALVIGNGNYAETPLKNPVNDAIAITAKLRTLGFEVIEKHNLTQKQIGPTLREFRSKLSPGGTALFFYAGHGLQVDGTNYLPAVDADIGAEEDVPTQAIDVNKVLSVMEGGKTRVNLVYLDACRNNPYARSFRSAGEGLAKINAPRGTLIFYATRPGSVAADGDGQNGLYTQYLLAAMSEPGLAVEQVQKRVAAGVEQSSKGKQTPWMEGLLTGDFFFRPGEAGANTQTATPATVDPDAAEYAEWAVIESAPTREAVQSYLDGVKSKRWRGVFVKQAAALLKQMSATEPAARPGRVETASRPGVDPVEADYWKEVSGGDDPELYATYLRTYPQGRYVADANEWIARDKSQKATKAKVQEDRAWKTAQDGNRYDSYAAYLQAYPNGRYAELAKLKQGKLKPARQPFEPEMVAIPGKDYEMGKYEVTVAQFAAFVNDTGHNVGNSCWTKEGGEWKGRSGRNWRSPGFSQGDDSPVACVNWDDAQTYVQWLARKTGKLYRLPNEDEWKHACDGGQGNEYCGGNDLDGVGWYNQNSGDKTHPVGQKRPNGYGLYDMTGNVWEWQQDCWEGDCGKRVLRGGSWSNLSENARAANRGRGTATERGIYVGFRVARSARTF